MKLYSIECGNFMLDGGAMFGVVPKTIWQKLYPADDKNLCNWATRSLLIEDGNRLILIDCGIGTKQDEKFLKYYYLNGDFNLEISLNKIGFSKNNITDLFLTHLHFDHCGGAIEKINDKLLPTFKNATYWSNANHWQWAVEPNQREKASFLKENILPIKESGQLNFVDLKNTQNEILPKVSFENVFEIIKVDGHTDAMMLPKISYKGRTIVYVADLFPSFAHVPIPYVAGYDTRPLLSMNEKEIFLKEALDNDYILFFEHDIFHECCTLQQTEKGIRPKDFFKLSEL